MLVVPQNCSNLVYASPRSDGSRIASSDKSFGRPINLCWSSVVVANCSRSSVESMVGELGHKF